LFLHTNGNGRKKGKGKRKKRNPREGGGGKIPGDIKNNPGPGKKGMLKRILERKSTLNLCILNP